MAYFSGNAMYMKSSKREGFEMNTCGAARVSQSTFLENFGTKTSDGGALSFVCDYVKDSQRLDFVGASDFDGSLIDPEGVTSISSIADPTREYTLLVEDQLSISIADSSFTGNAAGFKGSSIFAHELSSVKIEDSVFESNKPVSSEYEATLLPAFTRYLLNESQTSPPARILSYTSENEAECGTSELEHLELCYSPSTYIPQSDVQGTVFVAGAGVKSCNQDTEGYTCGANSLYISGCTFTANSIEHVLQVDDGEKRASNLFLKEVMSIEIQDTTFSSHG